MRILPKRNYNDDYHNYVDKAAMPLDEDADFNEACTMILAMTNLKEKESDFTIALPGGGEMDILLLKVRVTKRGVSVKSKGGKVRTEDEQALNDTFYQPVGKDLDTRAVDTEFVELGFARGLKVSRPFMNDGRRTMYLMVTPLGV